MHKKKQAIQLLLQEKLLPLYYHESAEVSIGILRALYDAGLKIVEYTNRGDNALQNFKQLKKAVKENMPGMLLGIGTIKNVKQARQYIKAGAGFIVCPSIDEDVAKFVSDAGLLWIPGCMTPTEIVMAENAGATIVKIFPGNILGPTYLNAIKELFPGLKFMPSGGVEAEENNLKAWFDSGVEAVGMGSKLITKEIMQHKNYELLNTVAKEILALVKRVSGSVG
jgi:2-dehydro-3-deoxyphosphogluconate aldolase/(4S)-4-hydroxy-2-oxoglutarate aldolase